MKERQNLDAFDYADYPRAMKSYLRNYGYHFNKKACKEAIRRLRRKNPATGQNEPLGDEKDKGEVEAILSKHNIKLECDVLYDAVWAYHMLVSDLWKEAIDDELHLAKAVKCVVDDPDQPDGYLFNRWMSDQYFAGHPIEWEDLL